MGACTSYPCYCSWTDVLNYSGFDSDRVIELSIRHTTATQVQDLIEEYIADATAEINDLLGINITIRKEKHLGTGEDDVFELGQEDEEGAYYHDPSDSVLDVIQCWLGGHTASYRKLRPYPTEKDYINKNVIQLRGCELGTEVTTLVNTWDESTATDSLDTTTFIAGIRSIELVYANATQFGRFPSQTANYFIDKNIDIYSYIAYYVRSDTANIEVTIRLYDVDGNYNYASFTITKANHWYLVMLDIDEDFSGTVASWDDTNLMYIELWVDAACTLNVDNLNINDGWMYTAPAGEIAIMRQLSDEPIGENYPFYVTYRYNPYENPFSDSISAVRNVKKACACLAGMDLIDFLRGIRVEETEMDVQSESGVPNPTRDVLANTRKDLERKYDRAMRSIGYGWDFIPVKDLNACED